MKKAIGLFVPVLLFTVCLLSSFTPAKTAATATKTLRRTVITVTKNFTTSNGLPAVSCSHASIHFWPGVFEYYGNYSGRR